MERLKEFVREEIAEARAWCKGRHWFLRLAMWGWFAYIFVHHWRDPEYDSFLGGLNLGIHEFGHLICMPFGKFVTVAGGSGVQCLVPLISLYMFYRQQDYFAFSFSFVWLGTNLYGVSRYISDSRALKLELVTPFGGGDGETMHDWNYLLNEMGMLSRDTQIGSVVHACGTVAMVAGLLWGAWMIWLMLTSGKKEVGEDWDVPELKP